MSESGGGEASGRVRGLVHTKPIVYGNIARYFGKKREEDGHTHRWTVFLRPYASEDMAVYVKRVQFKLHDSYSDSVRVLTKPPYEVSETGWGEFDMTIKIHFVDPQEKPVVISHLLKLFQNDTDIMMGRKNLVREFYDELVFVDPSPVLQRALAITRPLTVNHETDFEERMTGALARIADLNQKTSGEIVTLKEQLKQKKSAIDLARGILDDLESDTLRG